MKRETRDMTLRTNFIEGFEAAILTTIIRFRGDSGINLVREFCKQVDSTVQLYLAKDISEAEHKRIVELGDAVKAKAQADNLVTAPDFGKWLEV
jgi:hypothetical protein